MAAPSNAQGGSGRYYRIPSGRGERRWERQAAEGGRRLAFMHQRLALCLVPPLLLLPLCAGNGARVAHKRPNLKLSHLFSAALLAGRDDGAFFIRPHPSSEGKHILSVVFRGKPTQHVLAPAGDGSGMTINAKMKADGVADLAAVRRWREREGRTGWPSRGRVLLLCFFLPAGVYLPSLPFECGVGECESRACGRPCGSAAAVACPFYCNF